MCERGRLHVLHSGTKECGKGGMGGTDAGSFGNGWIKVSVCVCVSWGSGRGLLADPLEPFNTSTFINSCYCLCVCSLVNTHYRVFCLKASNLMKSLK